MAGSIRSPPRSARGRPRGCAREEPRARTRPYTWMARLLDGPRPGRRWDAAPQLRRDADAGPQRLAGDVSSPPSRSLPVGRPSAPLVADTVASGAGGGVADAPNLGYRSPCPHPILRMFGRKTGTAWTES